MEQAGLRQAELDTHPVRSGMKNILRVLDQLCPSDPDGAGATPDGTGATPDGTGARPDYMRTFLDYVNTMAAVLVRSLSPEGEALLHLCSRRCNDPGLPVGGTVALVEIVTSARSLIGGLTVYAHGYT